MKSLFPVVTFIFLLLNEIFCHSINDTAQHSVFTFSNFVDIKNNNLFLQRVEEILENQKHPFTFVINGDLVNSKFDKNYEKDSLRISELLSSLIKFENGNTIIIPGERDWDDSKKDGLKNVKKLEDLIKSFDYENVEWAIKNGCPGPKDFELNKNLLLITINTQWWNHPHEVPGPIDGNCKVATTDDFKEELEDLIDENLNKNIIIAGHYPIYSNGEYGGHLPFYKHLFPLTEWIDNLYLPLPIIGSYYASYRENIGTTDDICNENYEETRELIENIINQYESLVYLSGHDKTQQIACVEGNYHINSGAPEKSKFGSIIEGSILRKKGPGLIEIVYHPDGKVTSLFHEFQKKSTKPLSTPFTLMESPCIEASQNNRTNKLFIPCREIPSPTQKMTKAYPETGFAIAGPEYEAGSLKRFLLGDHYRDSWTQKVEVPYLNLDTSKGGLTPIKKGGGRQTISLKFIGKNGIRYTFRSVNKDPVKALSYDLRETGIARIVKDQTTTQHPYGALAADILLNQLGIIHAHPKLYLMPDDPKLGPFQDEFGNMLGMLEEHPKDPPKGKTGYLGAVDIVKSNKLFRKLYNDHNNRINTKEFAIARVFDILVGDWGKHEDNWKWIGFQEGEQIIYRPMPRDRDHVFSRWDGLLPWIYDREWAKESGEDFNYEISGLRSLMNQARHLDRFVAADLNKQDWISAAEFVQSKLNDEVIEKAVRNMPPETYELSGKIIADKLRHRLNDLKKY
ncbi:MAG: hypothetical protein R3250_04540, partial [Melioribacteraceae bacterium]|nr:hypothetical protein [Melioribacteraceae bacterium]